jgi:N,N'-diacetylchitobiose transport system permease protein
MTLGTTTEERTKKSPSAPRRRRGALAPYALTAPALLVLTGVLGYPLVKLLILSFQQWGLKQIFSGSSSAPFVGFKNYTRILTDSFFWTVVERTVLVAAAMVVGSMVVGVGVALLMQRVPGRCRGLMTFALVLAWAVPHPVATSRSGSSPSTGWRTRPSSRGRTCSRSTRSSGRTTPR